MPLTYHEVTVVKAKKGNYTINLDGQELQSTNSVVIFPNESLACEVAKELGQLKDNLSFSDLPITRRTLAAYDRVTPNRNRIDDIVLNIALTDVICYRAVNQPDLNVIEKEKWECGLAGFFRASDAVHVFLKTGIAKSKHGINQNVVITTRRKLCRKTG